MKTNQIFNFTRFGRYAKSTLILTYRQTLMIWGTIATSIFLLSLFFMVLAHDWNNNEWIRAFFIVLFGGGIIYAGMSFPSFRKKEKTIVSLMVPVTALERFLYELLEKIVAFLILLPLFFQIFSSFAVFVSNAAEPGKITTEEYMINNTVVKFQSFPYDYISWGSAIKSFEDGLLFMILSFAFFAFTLAFAGAATFRKYPLIKTIVFCGAVIAMVSWYLYILIEKINLRHPWIANLEHQWSAQQGFMTGSIILIISSLIMLTFTYFKIKEKEVQ